MTTNLVVATIVCDFKNYSMEEVVRNNLALDVPEGCRKLVYLNVETAPSNVAPMEGYEYLADLREQNSLLHYDSWAWQSTWRRGRAIDQDQGHRLPPIVTARNMAIEFARATGAQAIMYVDSDVLVPRNALAELWKELQGGRAIVGGMVPGRGCHSHVHYLGSAPPKPVEGRKNLVVTDYATAGFVMICRQAFLVVTWRWGGSVERPYTSHSEDPLFGYDVKRAGMGGWYVRTDLHAAHVDHVDLPLVEKGTSAF